MSLRIEERFVGKYQLVPGMLVRLSYTKSDNTFGTYSILVVDPNRTSERSRSTQLHGYNVDGISDADIINFLVQLNYPIIVDTQKQELRLPELSIQDAYDSLKSATSLERPYRIFTLSNVGSIKQIVIELQDEVREILGNEIIFIENKRSKERVIQILNDEDFESLKSIPEIKEVLGSASKSRKRTI